MSARILQAAALGLAMMAAPAWASTKACLMEGSFTLLGKTTEIRDCMENGGVPAAQFTEMCTGLVDMVKSMGGPGGKITYLPACPAAPQGVCERIFQQPLTAYYYKRDPASLADVRKGCEAQGGKWR